MGTSLKIYIFLGLALFLFAQSGLGQQKRIARESFQYDTTGLLIALRSSDLESYAIGAPITSWNGLVGSATSTTANGPKLDVGSNGFRGARFYGTNYLTFTAPAAMNTNCTVFIVLEGNSGLDVGQKGLLSGATTQIYWDSHSTSMELVAILTNSVTFSITAPIPVSNPGRYVVYFNFGFGDTNYPNKINFGLNKAVMPISYPIQKLDWQGGGVTSIGSATWSLTGGSGITGMIYELAIYTNSLSSDKAQEIIENLRNKYSCKDPSYVYLDGDQGLIGGAMGTSEKQYAPVYHQLNKMFLDHSGGITASTLRALSDIGTAATNLTSGVLPLAYFPGRDDHLYLVYYGETYLLGSNAASLWPILSNCMAVAKSQGYIVPAMTLFPAGGTNDAERLLYNSWVRQYWPNCASALVDFMQLPFTAPTDYTNSTYYLNDSGPYIPSRTQSIAASQFLMRTIKSMCSTNLVVK